MDASKAMFCLFLFSTFLLSQVNILQAQDVPAKKQKHEAELADKYFGNFDYYLAAKEYEKVLNYDPANKYALFRLAESYRMFFNYDKAEEYYKKATETAIQDYPEARFWHALMLKTNGRYEDAQKEFRVYLDEAAAAAAGSAENKALYDKAQLEMDGCDLALTEMKKPQRDYMFENLPGPVNTPDSEYSPTIYENDSSIVLSSARDESEGDKEYGGLGGSFSDDYRFVKSGTGWAEKTSDDQFDVINTKFNESAGVFNKDKTKFYFSRCDEQVKTSEGTEFQCGIYLSQQKNGKWTTAVKLNENVNMKGEWNAQPSISPNADTLFFVSKRPGGQGMHDIWYTTCSGDDNWGAAVNLGAGINTAYIDMSPNYYSKERTLFFASNGIKGFGGLDIYMAKGESFSEVSTVGLPFNSNRDDFYFVLGEKKGFLASNRQLGKGNDDIYTFNIEGQDAIIAFVDKDSMQKVKSISIEGKLLNETTKKPVEDVEVLLKDAQDKTLKRTVTDEAGHFKYDNLPADQDYKITLNDKERSLTKEVNYISDSLTIKGSGRIATRTLFEDIFFDFNRYELRPEASKTLDDLVIYYKKYPEIQIELDATTDDIGSDDYNIKLSSDRGNEAMKYLIAHGVKKKALVVKAFGKSRPLVPNKNHIARQLNRRVEFYVLGGPGYKATTMAYVIEPSMDVYQVAQKFNMSVDELKLMNNLKNDTLLIYRPLRVRRTGDNDIIAPVTITHLDDEDIKENAIHPETAGMSQEEVRKAALQHAHELPVGQEYYIVEPKNTLYSIAKLNGMSQEELMTLNKLKNGNIHVGQKLKVKKGR